MPALFLYYRQTYSVDFLIDIECIDIRHTTDVIQYRHDSLLQILVLYVVLAAYPSQELLGVERDGFTAASMNTSIRVAMIL